MTDTRKLEGDIGPHFRTAIRQLRERFARVEPYAFDPNENVVLVSVENNDGEVYTRRLSMNEDNTVFEQDRRKINGHYGPTLRVDRHPGDPGVLTSSVPEPLPKSALRRATVRRLRSGPVEKQLFPQSLAGKRATLLNALNSAERAFQKSPDRLNLMTLQGARIALNAIDERIVRTHEAEE